MPIGAIYLARNCQTLKHSQDCRLSSCLAILSGMIQPEKIANPKAPVGKIIFVAKSAIAVNKSYLPNILKSCNTLNDSKANRPNAQQIPPIIIAALFLLNANFSINNTTNGSAMEIDDVKAANQSIIKNKPPKNVPKGI